MLTRLEADGFKNLVGVAVDLGPFTCVAGPNGIGKSNLFDAIRFLSLLAEHRIADAARRVRGSDDDPTDLRELFTRIPGTPEPTHPMTLAVEALLPHYVQDAFGSRSAPSITFVRYELQLRYQAPTGEGRVGRIRVQREHMVHINLSDASKHLPWPHSARHFRKAVVTGRRTGTAFISTGDVDGGTVIRIHQDGGSRGSPRTAPAAAATATVIGATNSVDDPTIFALKQEMAGWRHLALEPSAMRRPDKYWDVAERPRVAATGAHIPATLWSLAASDEARADLMAWVAVQLSDLVPVHELRIRPNDANQQFELELSESPGAWLGARSLSEGTLRFLALVTVAADPESARLLCMEEPENGIHPERLPAMLDLLDLIAVDAQHAPDADNPVRQVLVNTHSPRFVQLLEARGRAADLLVAESALVRLGDHPVKTVRFQHRSGTWRERTSGPGVGPGLAVAYLTVPKGAQLALMVADGP